MNRLVVDANVWVGSLDPKDPFYEVNRAFLKKAIGEGYPIDLPALALLEVACVLARRLRDPEGARNLAQGLVHLPLVHVHPLDRALLEASLWVGTEAYLRSGDAVYAGLARLREATLITWDQDLRRLGGMTPEEWLATPPRGGHGS